jgi:hypothetical protein
MGEREGFGKCLDERFKPLGYAAADLRKSELARRKRDVTHSCVLPQCTVKAIIDIKTDLTQPLRCDCARLAN